MSREFFKSIAGEEFFCVGSDILGYSLEDLERIERLYDVRISGQLKSFLLEMGRSDGGLIGDSIIQLYRPSWRIRAHLLFQVDFFSQMQESGNYVFLNKPFVLAWISETQYYFVQTLLADDAIYHYDSNVESVVKTRWDICCFMKSLVSERVGDMKVGVVGNLLEI
ncbi:hypothetical protein [Pseudomonas sp. MF4836]|uniref:hypothetical protein n=1 Tax=Pseudomonas sp. MF4836 TaxID=1960827 RepID=UPI00099820B7|nr:hypothetical protein [Pseudomonas sp. MF4836]OOV99540.1 hypothetical protein MF4836_04725 [Pseudomonas sp. MF4836]